MKLLPKTKNNPQGFTLVELLVVISILAILAIVGFASFRGVANRGNDTRRKGDIDAIAKALELNKTPSGYQPLADTNFAGGVIPTDPTSGKSYCLNTSATAQKPSQWPSGCPTSGGWTPIAAGVPAANSTGWKICASMQVGTEVFCVSSSQ